MRKLLHLSFLCIILTSSLQAQWSPVGDRIKTKWAEEIDPSNILSKYPRPISFDVTIISEGDLIAQVSYWDGDQWKETENFGPENNFRAGI